MRLDLSGIIAEFSAPLYALRRQGSYDLAGQWQAGAEERVPFFGAVLRKGEKRRRGTGGMLVEKTIHLFTQAPLPGTELLFEGDRYFIQRMVHNADVTGTYMYEMCALSREDV